MLQGHQTDSKQSRVDGDASQVLASSLYYTCRDDKSPVSGGRFSYLDVHYGLPYGRTYLPFSPLTIVHLLTQFSRKLAMRETLHDCKHGELE